jgi:hypothetical protein
MNDKKDKKLGSSPLRSHVERLSRVFALFWGFIILLGFAATYFHRVLPWIADAVSLGVVAWVVIAIVRWRRSKW